MWSFQLLSQIELFTSSRCWSPMRNMPWAVDLLELENHQIFDNFLPANLDKAISLLICLLPPRLKPKELDRTWWANLRKWEEDYSDRNMAKNVCFLLMIWTCRKEVNGVLVLLASLFVLALTTSSGMTTTMMCSKCKVWQFWQQWKLQEVWLLSPVD